MNASVVLATYNGEKYIIDQINSIIIGMDENDELIISDDSSTDETLSIIEDYVKKDNRIHFYRNSKKGVVWNFENGLSKTTKDIILFSDQDDIWLPEKIDLVKKTFEDNKDVFLVLHDMYETKDDEFERYLDSPRSFEIRKRKHGVFYNLLYSGYYGCCMAITKEFKELLIPFSKNVIMHDQWIGLIAEHYKRSFFLNKPLVIHRIHGDNLTKKRNIIEKMIIRFKSFLAYKNGLYHISKKTEDIL